MQKGSSVVVLVCCVAAALSCSQKNSVKESDPGPPSTKQDAPMTHTVRPAGLYANMSIGLYIQDVLTDCADVEVSLEKKGPVLSVEMVTLDLLSSAHRWMRGTESKIMPGVLSEQIGFIWQEQFGYDTEGIRRWLMTRYGDTWPPRGLEDEAASGEAKPVDSCSSTPRTAFSQCVVQGAAPGLSAEVTWHHYERPEDDKEKYLRSCVKAGGSWSSPGEVTLSARFKEMQVEWVASRLTGDPPAFQTKEETTLLQLKELNDMLSTWMYAKKSDCPKNLLQVLKFANRKQTVLKDSWGNDFEMVCKKLSAGFQSDVFSRGPDGRLGTDDDISEY